MSFAPFIFSWIIGSSYQRKCKRATDMREKANQSFISTTIRKPTGDAVSNGLVHESIVISPSWWQMTIAGLKSLIGGTITYYDPILSWGRQEALVRLKERAQQDGWDEIHNIRLETSTISKKGGNKGTATVEILAYGTGIRRL